MDDMKHELKRLRRDGVTRLNYVAHLGMSYAAHGDEIVG